jgi:hypothetical protein
MDIMKPITLTNAEAAHLATHDELVVVREVKPHNHTIERLSCREEFASSGLHQLSRKETPGYAYFVIETGGVVGFPCPLGAPGQRLWIKESWRQAYAKTKYSNGIIYRADKAKALGMDEYSDRHSWRSPVTMPKEASRWTVVVEDVQVKQMAGERNPEQVWCWVVKVRKEA